MPFFEILHVNIHIVGKPGNKDSKREEEISKLKIKIEKSNIGFMEILFI